MGLKRARKTNRRKAKPQAAENRDYFMHSRSLAEDEANWSNTKFSSKDTPEARAIIVDALQTGHTKGGAAVKAGIHPRTFQVWLAEDETFKKIVEEAIEIGNDFIEEEIRRRAVIGTDRPVFQGGAMVGVVREYSDKLTEFLMTARKPERFGKQRHELSGPGGAPIPHKVEVEFVKSSED